MISGKMKLGAAVIVAALIATPLLARAIHKTAAPLDRAYELAQPYNSNAVVGPDGKLIGEAPDPSIRAQLQRDGLPY